MGPQQRGRRSGGLKALGWNGHPARVLFVTRRRASHPHYQPARPHARPHPFVFCFECVSRSGLAAASDQLAGGASSARSRGRLAPGPRTAPAWHARTVKHNRPVAAGFGPASKAFAAAVCIQALQGHPCCLSAALPARIHSCAFAAQAPVRARRHVDNRLHGGGAIRSLPLTSVFYRSLMP